ncbi:Ion transport protein-domain-containing protein [Haematococcus lacustris]
MLERNSFILFGARSPEQRGRAEGASGNIQQRLRSLYVRLDSNNHSFWIFSPSSVIRRNLLYLSRQPWYAKLVMTLVILNVIFMGVEDPTCTGECAAANPTKKQALTALDLFFTVAFTIDVCIQAVSHNFILGPGAFLKTGWGWLDFLTTASGYLAYLPLGDSSSLSGVRALRALRALRAINAIPGLRQLVKTLLLSLPLLLDVFMLLMWILAVFGIVALHLFMGELRGRCMAQAADPGVPLPPPLAPPLSPQLPSLKRQLLGSLPAASLPATALQPSGSLDPLWRNLERQAGWGVDQAGGGSGGGRGGGQAGRIWHPHEQAQRLGWLMPLQGFDSGGVQAGGRAAGRQLLKGGSSAPSGDEGAGGDSGSDNATWLIVPGYENVPCALHDQGMLTCPGDAVCQWTDQNPNNGFTTFDHFGGVALNVFIMLTMDNWSEVLLYPLMNSMGPGVPITFFVLLVLLGSFFALQLLIAVLSSKFAQLQSQVPKAKKRRKPKRRPLQRQDTDDEQWQARLQQHRQAALDPEGQPVRGWAGLRAGWTARADGWTRRAHNAWVCVYNRLLSPTHPRQMWPWRRRLYNMCFASWFSHMATAMIMTNTMVFAMTYADQPHEYTAGLEIVNTVLTAGFILEFSVKHVGLGLVRYWTDAWNILDGSIVIISIVELLLLAALAGSGAGELQALRTFRVLRILRSLRLLAKVPGLRRLMKLVIKGFVALADFFLLLGIFIWIFAIIGMQQFGGNPAFSCSSNPDTCRSNYDTLWEALYTSFQVLTLDDWVHIAFMAMEGTGPAAVLYFVIWVVIGNFILLTLFLAILINNFQDEPELTPEQEAVEIAEEAYLDGASATSVATTESGLQHEGNAFLARVNERHHNQLDLDLVKDMKAWFVMMGLDHGLTQQDIEQAEARLQQEFDEEPRRFSPDYDYFMEKRVATKRTAAPLTRASMATSAGALAADVAAAGAPGSPWPGCGPGGRALQRSSMARRSLALPRTQLEPACHAEGVEAVGHPSHHSRPGSSSAASSSPSTSPFQLLQCPSSPATILNTIAATPSGAEAGAQAGAEAGGHVSRGSPGVHPSCPAGSVAGAGDDVMPPVTSPPSSTSEAGSPRSPSPTACSPWCDSQSQAYFTAAAQGCASPCPSPGKAQDEPKSDHSSRPTSALTLTLDGVHHSHSRSPSPSQALGRRQHDSGSSITASGTAARRAARPSFLSRPSRSSSPCQPPCQEDQHQSQPVIKPQQHQEQQQQRQQQCHGLTTDNANSCTNPASLPCLEKGETPAPGLSHTASLQPATPPAPHTAEAAAVLYRGDGRPQPPGTASWLPAWLQSQPDCLAPRPSAEAQSRPPLPPPPSSTPHPCHLLGCAGEGRDLPAAHPGPDPLGGTAGREAARGATVRQGTGGGCPAGWGTTGHGPPPGGTAGSDAAGGATSVG